MEGTLVVALVLIAVVSSASLECIDNNNCTEPVPILSVNLGSIFPFFGPVDIDNEENKFDDAIDPLESKMNDSQKIPPQDEGILSINFMQVISFNNDDLETPTDLKFPGFQFIFEKNNLMDSSENVLDLSGRHLTGNELAAELRAHQLLVDSVTTLILSNSRIQGLTMESFLPVETTLQKLWMDNCSVPLSALYRLSNLQFLNLSNSGLTTFEWYPQLRDTLEVLDLSHNQLAEVRPELSVLTSLRELNLSYNRIGSVKEYPLVMLPNLEVVSFTMNTLTDATFKSLLNLQRVDLDWNFLILCGSDLTLPPQHLSVKLASNPWRCDCGLLEARENYNLLDIDLLSCANHGAYTYCDDCVRSFLPCEYARPVANLTKDSIEHLGCTGLTDQYYLMRQAVVRLRDHEPQKLILLVMMITTIILLLALAVLIGKRSCKKNPNRSWLKIQQIPYLKISKLDKSQEVPCIKIDTPEIKA